MPPSSPALVAHWRNELTWPGRLRWSRDAPSPPLSAKRHAVPYSSLPRNIMSSTMAGPPRWTGPEKTVLESPAEFWDQAPGAQMSDDTDTKSVRFGRTVVTITTGHLLQQTVDAVMVAANARGMIGGGSDSVRTVGGDEIEQETMRRAPLRLGDAVVSGPGLLRDRGVRAVIHAVTSAALGEPARLRDARRAFVAALEQADESHLRSLALSPLPASAEGGMRVKDEQLRMFLVEDLIGYLRRGTTHLERVVVVAPFPDHVEAFLAAFREARRSSWIAPS